jgi:hypothetical protein
MTVAQTALAATMIIARRIHEGRIEIQRSAGTTICPAESRAENAGIVRAMF